MGSITVTCYRNGKQPNYELIALAMHHGIRRMGDDPRLTLTTTHREADVGLIYGWKHHDLLYKHRRFLYADLGYWSRETHWRFAANAWSPNKHMRRGMPADRFRSLGVNVLPEHGGKYVLVLGATMKSCFDHGLHYMSWERRACEALLSQGAKVLYRPKPKDKAAKPIDGTEYAQSANLGELFAQASLVVAHHSNACVEAIAAGCSVHCEQGAASLRSVPLTDWKAPKLIPGREQFLCDVAYTQWTVEEMRNGKAWNHMRKGVLN